MIIKKKVNPVNLSIKKKKWLALSLFGIDEVINKLL